jgi:hypothetical protein
MAAANLAGLAPSTKVVVGCLASGPNWIGELLAASIAGHHVVCGIEADTVTDIFELAADACGGDQARLSRFLSSVGFAGSLVSVPHGDGGEDVMISHLALDKAGQEALLEIGRNVRGSRILNRMNIEICGAGSRYHRETEDRPAIEDFDIDAISTFAAQPPLSDSSDRAQN